MSWKDTELAKLSKERVFLFIQLTILEERHSLFSIGVGVILGIGYWSNIDIWHAECEDTIVHYDLQLTKTWSN